MPATLQFFDMEVNLPASQSINQPVPVSTGVNWEPGDIRVFYQLWFQPIWNYHMSHVNGGSGTSGVGVSVNMSGSGSGQFFGNVSGTSCSGSVSVNVSGSGSGSGSSSYSWPSSFDSVSQVTGPNALVEPTGYNTLGNILPTDTGQELGYSVSWRRLQAGDTDTFVAYELPEAMAVFSTILFTVRGVDPSWNPTTSGSNNWGFLNFPNSANINIASSVTVPAAGTLVYLATSYPAPQVSTNAPPYTSAQYTGFSIDTPNNWTSLVATSSSGNTYFPYYAQSSAIAVAKTYPSGQATGSVTFPAGESQNPAMDGIFLWFKPAQDVVGTTGSATTHSGAGACTGTSSSTVIGSTGDASTTSGATTCFNRFLGYFVSDPLALDGSPVTGSIVRWNAVTPSGSAVTVETSINSGATWDLAVNDRPIPRLREGDTATQSVLVRATMTQTMLPTFYPNPGTFPGPNLFPNGSGPRLLSLEFDVSSDNSVDELVPIGHGMIDKVTVHATSGTTGSGSSTNVVGSTGVIGRGGGQTGGGKCIKVHVNDLSYAVKRNVWQMPFTLPSGMLYTDAIKAMVLNRLPDQTSFNMSSTTRVTPVLVYGVQQGGDPWQDIQELAQAIGYEAFFDALGTLVCRPVPDPRLGEAVWQFDETAVQLVTEAERELSSEQTYNDIVVVGQSTSTANPFSAEAFDDDPSSPTYVLGPYGTVSQRLTFSLITSQDQAQDVANATLYNSIGGADTVTLTVVPQPALEPGDIVKVVCSNVAANGTYMINSISTPLSPADPMSITCFRQSTSS